MPTLHMTTHFLYDTVQSLIIIFLCLTIVYPKAIERYRRQKKLRETQASKGIEEVVRKIVRDYLEELKKE